MVEGVTALRTKTAASRRPGGTPYGLPMTRAQIEHVQRGLHSRIPICCIAYFVTTYFPKWAAYRKGDIKAARYIRRHVRRNHATAKRLGHKRPPGYVPCPACVRAGNIIHVHMCTLRCRGKLGTELGHGP